MDTPQALRLEDIRRILILGGGTMGLRIGLQAAISGYEVVIYDIDPKVFEKARSFQDKILRSLVKRDLVKAEDTDAIHDRMSWTGDLKAACENVDLVNESVIENLDIKKKVWTELGELCPPHTLFTTNTSYLKPSMMAEDTGRPGRFCGFHFHDVFLANVVDVMPHPGTEEWVSPLLMEIGKTLNQTPVFVKKENRGYIFNAMLLALIGAAGRLVTSDVASFQDVDRSWMGNFKMDMGPFGILDTVGLDTAWHITSSLPDEKSQAFAALLKTYIDEGKRGVKTGAGFYDYPNPEYKQDDFIQ